MSRLNYYAPGPYPGAMNGLGDAQADAAEQAARAAIQREQAAKEAASSYESRREGSAIKDFFGSVSEATSGFAQAVNPVVGTAREAGFDANTLIALARGDGRGGAVQAPAYQRRGGSNIALWAILGLGGAVALYFILGSGKSSNPRRGRRRRRRKNPMNMDATTLALLAAGGAAAYFFLSKKQKKPAAALNPWSVAQGGIAAQAHTAGNADWFSKQTPEVQAQVRAAMGA